MKRAIIILIFLYGALCCHAETQRTYHDSIRVIADSTLFFILTDGSKAAVQAIEVRASLPDAGPGKPHDSFGILWDVSDDGTTYYSATLQPVSGYGDEIMDSRHLLFTVSHHSPDGITQLHQSKLKDGFGMETTANTLGMELDRDSMTAIIYGGHQEPDLIYRMKMAAPFTGRMGVEAIGKCDVSLLVTETIMDDNGKLLTDWTSEKIENYLQSGSVEFPEGRYRYLDRETDSRYARPGGKYEIALVRNTSTGGYDIIYLGGAEINARSWQPGMLKGHLSPTIFSSHYDLEWFDASMASTSDECSADVEQRAILRLNFPLLKSTLRFSYLPPDM